MECASVDWRMDGMYFLHVSFNTEKQVKAFTAGWQRCVLDSCMLSGLKFARDFEKENHCYLCERKIFFFLYYNKEIYICLLLLLWLHWFFFGV